MSLHQGTVYTHPLSSQHILTIHNTVYTAMIFYLFNDTTSVTIKDILDATKLGSSSPPPPNPLHRYTPSLHQLQHRYTTLHYPTAASHHYTPRLRHSLSAKYEPTKQMSQL